MQSLTSAVSAHVNALGMREMLWIGIGFVGQFLFMMRFLWQWIQSERQQRSMIDRLLVFQPGGRGDPLCSRRPRAGPGLYRRTDVWIDGLHAQSVADPPRKTRRSTRRIDLRASGHSRWVT